MNNYLNLFDKLLKNFLDDDFVENATKIFNEHEQTQRCNCKKDDCDNEKKNYTKHTKKDKQCLQQDIFRV